MERGRGWDIPRMSPHTSHPLKSFVSLCFCRSSLHTSLLLISDTYRMWKGFGQRLDLSVGWTSWPAPHGARIVKAPPVGLAPRLHVPERGGGRLCEAVWGCVRLCGGPRWAPDGPRMGRPQQHLATLSKHKETHRFLRSPPPDLPRGGALLFCFDTRVRRAPEFHTVHHNIQYHPSHRPDLMMHPLLYDAIRFRFPETIRYDYTIRYATIRYDTIGSCRWLDDTIRYDLNCRRFLICAD